VLINSSVLTQNPAPSPLPVTVDTPPDFGSRPSRDIVFDAGGYEVKNTLPDDDCALLSGLTGSPLAT
jgi:hypothetical protein